MLVSSRPQSYQRISPAEAGISPSRDSIFGLLGLELIGNKCHSSPSDTAPEGADLGAGRWGMNIPQLRAPIKNSGCCYTIPSPLHFLLLGNRAKDSFAPEPWTNAQPDVMGSTREGVGPTWPPSWWLKQRPPLPADAPSGKGHRDPGLTTDWAEQALWEEGPQPGRHYLHVSPAQGTAGRLSTVRIVHSFRISGKQSHSPHRRNTVNRSWFPRYASGF